MDNFEPIDLTDEDTASFGLTIPTDDDGIARRVKAVAATRPIHDLERNKSSYTGGFWDAYELSSLAIATIDQVALAMGISAGMPYPEAITYCAGQAARQQPDRHSKEHTAVAERVLAALVTDDPHETTYFDHGPSAETRRTHRFRLLYEQWASADEVYLRASEEAINVLVDALDLDIESAQIAAEAQMRALIERGALESAVGVARRARYQTIQYLERIRSITRDTVIDPDSFDWAEEVPALLERALDHVCDRINAELALLGAVEERRDATLDPGMRRSANQLIAMLHECRGRHSDLQRHLLGARAQLRKAQDDRFARPRTGIRRADLERDLLNRALAAPAAAVADWGEQRLIRMAAPRRLFQPTLPVLVDELLEPPREPAEGEELPEPVFGEPQPPWWVPYWDVADDLVAGVANPTRLANLLARARALAATTADDDGTPLDPETLAGVVCHIAHEHLAVPFVDREAGTSDVCAVTTGERLDDPAVDADNLLITPVDFTDTDQPATIQAAELTSLT